MYGAAASPPMPSASRAPAGTSPGRWPGWGACSKGGELLLLSGVTTVNDMFHQANMGSLAGGDGPARGGGLGAEDLLYEPGGTETQKGTIAAAVDEHEALAHRCARTELIGFRFGAGSVIGQTDGLLAAAVAAARQHGWAAPYPPGRGPRGTRPGTAALASG